MTYPLRILALAILTTLALAYMIWDRATLLAHGRVVTLAVEPVDPQDLFRGDYVVLTYPMSRLDLNAIAGIDKVYTGQTVYVVLQSAGEDWKAIRVEASLPTLSDPNHAVIRGEVTSHYAQSVDSKVSDMVTIQYGIESFFVPQGQGKPIETQRNERTVTVDVALGPDGRAAIKRLRVGGQPVFEETLF